MKWFKLGSATLGLGVLALAWPAFMPMPWGHVPPKASPPAPRPLFDPQPWTVVIWALLVVALITVINHRYKSQATTTLPLPADGEDTSALDTSISDLERAFELRAEAANSGKMAALPMFISLVLQPEKSRTRTVETVSLEGRVIVQDVRIEMALSDALIDVFREEGAGKNEAPADEIHPETYVPILNCSKREMIDNFQVRDREDRSVDILCYEETVQLISSSLHLLVHAALPKATDDENITPDGIDTAEALFLMLMCSNKPVSDKTVEKTILAAFAHLGLRTRDGVESRNVTWLREFVKTLAHSTPVVAIVPDLPETRRLQISYCRTTIPPNKSKQLRHWLRLMLGLRPVTLQMVPGMAFNSKSYHLQVKAPASQYLMEQTLRCVECGQKLSGSEVETDGRGGCVHLQPPSPRNGHAEPYFQLLRKRGQNYAHLYMRGFADLKQKNIKISTSFGEVPPGTLASAVITAVTSVLLISAVGFAETGGLERDSDIPAILLVLPAVAASWFGFSSDTEAILRSSLAARCSLILGGFVSMAASVLFIVSGSLAEKTGAEPASLPPPGRVGEPAPLLGVEVRWWWSVLIYLASVNLVYVLVQSIVRSNAYRRLLRKETVLNENTVI
ncbi:hypothetical protein [Streptosporangium carneum]|nr:hypothetical protein [Streptosporangium carneum]